MLLNWIINNAMHTGFLFATAAMGVTEAPVGALVEAGSDGSAETTSEETVGSGVTTEPESTEGSEGAAPQAKPTQEAKVDWRTVPTEVKGHIQELQKTNPKLANLIQNAVYTSNNFLKEVPGGLKEIRALKSTIEEFGGVDEIRTLSTTYKALQEEQEALDTQARQGDVRVLDSLIDIAGDGFSKLMPQALQKWYSSDPEVYNHEMSKIVVNAMREGGLVADLNLAFRMLKLGTPEAVKEASDCLNRAAEWANGVFKVSNTVPQKPVVDPKIAEQQKDIETQRTKLFNDQFSSEFGGWRNRQIKDAVSTVSNGRQLTEYQYNTLAQRIVNDIKDILVADSEYNKNLNRLYEARDMAELLKFTRSRTSKLLPEVAKKAFRSLFSGSAPVKKPAPQPAATEKTNQPAAAAGTAAAPVKGWTKVDPSKAPAPNEIDDKKTSFEMKFRKQAILKNGNKVYWGNKVPA